MDYRIYAVRVFTTQWDKALSFYRDTLNWPLRYADEDLGWAQFNLGGCDIALERLEEDDVDAATLVGRFVGVSIEVSDIQATYQRLHAEGVKFEQAPELQPWGGILAHFQDIDGNVLTLLGNAAH